MKEVSVRDMRDNTYFDRPVYLDEGYILLAPDVPMSPELKKRLLAWDFASVLCDGLQIDGPSDSGSSEEQGATIEVPAPREVGTERTEAEAFFIDLVSFLENAFERFKTRDDLRLLEFTERAKQIITALRTQKRHLLSVDEAISPAKTHFTTHSAKTAILAIAIADYLKMAPYRVIEVGVAALLHQVGLLKIPEHLYLSGKELTPQERKTLAAHPVLSYRILKGLGYPQAVCIAVLEHNERLDGSGFPRAISGDRITLYGRILAVASSYSAATSKRPYRTAIDGHSGMLDLLKNAGKRYDEKILSALLFTLSLYPIGTHVIMSNGAIGIVVNPNPENPRFPSVKLLVNEHGNAYPGQPIVQTREGDEVTISRAIGKEDLSKLRR